MPWLSFYGLVGDSMHELKFSLNLIPAFGQLFNQRRRYKTIRSGLKIIPPTRGGSKINNSVLLPCQFAVYPDGEGNGEQECAEVGGGLSHLDTVDAEETGQD